MSEQKKPPVRQPMTELTFTSHIKDNIIKRTDPSAQIGRKCGDGRDEQNYMEAIFGSDLGYAFAAQAALRDLGKLKESKEGNALRKTLSIVAGEGQTYIHTDDHLGNEEQLFGGCGANKVARSNSSLFGLTQEDFSALDVVMEELNNNGKVERAVYKGDHNEGAVALVKGRDFSVRANDVKQGTSVFVATIDLIEDRLHDIAQKLSKDYETTEDELFRAMHARWQTQTEIIRKNLAHIKGVALPVYTVEFSDTGEPSITKVQLQ